MYVLLFTLKKKKELEIANALSHFHAETEVSFLLHHFMYNVYRCYYLASETYLQLTM